MALRLIPEACRLGTALLCAALAIAPLRAAAQNDPCSVSPETGAVTCSGDQSEGVGPGDPAIDENTHSLNVNDLDGPIRPAPGTEGILLESTSGAVTLNSGTSEETVRIEDVRASGIRVSSTGIASDPPTDPVLGIPIPGDESEPGGVTRIRSYSDVSTLGDDAIGIEARSQTSGYSDEVRQALSAFNESNIRFSVKSVGGQAANLGQPIPGIALDEEGLPDPGLDGGTFTINADGTFDFEFPADFGETLQTEVRYEVELENENDPAAGSRVTTGFLVVIATRTSNGVRIVKHADFPDFGVSYKPDAPVAVVYPDLDAWAESLLEDAENGGDGNGISISTQGHIETQGERSTGVLAESRGDDGGDGRDAGFLGFKGPASGHQGRDGGRVEVVADGLIETRGDEATGILALSVGGKGGAGGEGATFRSGARGGIGGDGGDVVARGSASIDTTGDSATGVLAISQGGDGGLAGDGVNFTKGGRGGQGGDAGAVRLDGSWDISTLGKDSHGIWAKSNGGNAGEGGSGGWLVSLPGAGGEAADGGRAEVHSAGGIETRGNDSYGIYAQSVGGFGGAGGAGKALLLSFQGGGSSAGSGGAVVVDIEASGWVKTHQERAHGVFAQSVGGGGGGAGSGGAILAIRGKLGGRGGDGGHGGSVDVTNHGRIETMEAEARGVFAQSIGGGGGDGGSNKGIFAWGGEGAGKSRGGEVAVTNLGTIETRGEKADAIFAESVGGGGGNGGSAGALIVAIGGAGGDGGDGGLVEVANSGRLATTGAEASGIFAQSLGGGGGNGGQAVTVSVSNLPVSVSVGIGGNGGKGGEGERVAVDLEESSDIATEGKRSFGLFAQSVGGGGGRGGQVVSVAASALPGTEISVGLGGSGGGGGAGAEVDVHANGEIRTAGSEAHGIFAQSVGGGGGSGGFAVAANVGVSAKVALGGGAGKGGHGFSDCLWNPAGPRRTEDGECVVPNVEKQAVRVDSEADVVTEGDKAYGILAQSVGGGGGDGGRSVTGSIATNFDFGLSVGGSGGGGGEGGAVEVDNRGGVATRGDLAHAILAQSVGGGGGSGGEAGAVSLVGKISIPETPLDVSASFETAVGGEGGDGNLGGRVDVLNEGRLGTRGYGAAGIFAQSVGGGGGAGGDAKAFTLDFDTSEFIPGGQEKPSVNLTSNTAIGGGGGKGGDAGLTRVVNEGGIDTSGHAAHGIQAQSVGGGGGRGGGAKTLSFDLSNLSVLIPPTGPVENVWDLGLDVDVEVGGDGGVGGHGGAVEVENTGDIVTRGGGSHGIFAHSIGGGGGAGGDEVTLPRWLEVIIDVEESIEDVGKWVHFLSNVKALDLEFDIKVGGRAGASGDGGDVSARNAGDILTLDDRSFGVLAQSVGGGGGIAAHGGGSFKDSEVRFLGLPPGFLPGIPIGEIIDAAGGVGVGGDDSQGDGGDIDVAVTGAIETRGVASHGVFAQSVGGGGGLAGNVDGGLDALNLGRILAEREDEGQVQVSGNAEEEPNPGKGDGGRVEVTGDGSIVTRGPGSNGIFAQSVGGSGGVQGTLGEGDASAGSAGGEGDGGDVEVDFSGDITTLGAVSHGILAQSAGGQGTGGDVSVLVRGNVAAQGEDSDAILVQSLGDEGSGEVSVTVGRGSSVQGGSGSGAGVRFLEGADTKLVNRGTVFAQSRRAIVGGDGDEIVDNAGLVIGNVLLGGGTNAFDNGRTGELRSGREIDLGGGTLLNEGLLSPGGSRVESTDLSGDFVQTQAGTYRTDLETSGAHDELRVSGSADLGGRVAVALEPGLYGSGSYRILSASLIRGGFDTLLPESKPLLGFGLTDRPGEIWLEVVARPFASAAHNRLERAVADYLDRIASDADGDLERVLGELQRIGRPADIQEAFVSLSPDAYDATTLAGIDSQRQYLRGLQHRMDLVRERRALGMKPKALGGMGMELAMTGSASLVLSVAGVAQGLAPTEEDARTSVWLDGLGQFGDQDGSDGFTGFDYRMGGGSLGVDRLFGSSFVAGADAGYAYSAVDLDAGRGRGDIDAIHGSLYGTWYTDEARGYVEGVLSYARQAYESRRLVVVDSISRDAWSDHDANVFGTSLGGGYRFDVAGFGMRPFANLSYVLLDEEGFTEKGAGDVSLDVGGRTTHSLVSELGLRVARAFRPEMGTFVPYASGAWKFDFDVDDRRIVSGFAGAPGTSFAVDGRDIDRNAGLVGAGVFFIRDRWSVAAEYLGEFRGDYTAHGVFARVGFAF